MKHKLILTAMIITLVVLLTAFWWIAGIEGVKTLIIVLGCPVLAGVVFDKCLDRQFKAELKKLENKE